MAPPVGSFVNLADALHFRRNKSSTNLQAPREVCLPRRPQSSLDLHHTANTRRKDIDEHLPTQVLARILTFCSAPTLSRCLTVSRLFFHLAGDLLYSDIALTSERFAPVFRGSAVVHEAATGKVAVGRKKFKDRLLKRTRQVTLYSHGDDEDEDQVLSGTACPPTPLNTVMPKLHTLRIVLADAFDYHMTFCPRYPHRCPLLKELSIEKLVILGARTPLVVLPLAFPDKTSQPTTPVGIETVSSYLSVPTLEVAPSIASSTTTSTPPFHGNHSTFSLIPHRNHSRNPSVNLSLAPPSSQTKQDRKTPPRAPSPSNTHHHSPRLPPLSELTIVMPTGLSYDVKDYQPHSHCFRHKRTLASIEKVSIVFYTPPPPPAAYGKKTREKGREQIQTQTQRPWQTAFYLGENSNSMTSYISLADDIAETVLSLPSTTEIFIVGCETLDGELFNMGMNTMQEGKRKVGRVMREKICGRVEAKWWASREKGDVRKVVGKIRFLELEEWLEGDGKGDVDGWDLDKWAEDAE
ncbi:hypothetical protein C366_05619 [Cryptococcus neoformans Tu401-1]|nr:hypothetical protein C365_05557 [Cryptococcus neoformans var. grubii Bt85]OXG12800.1 hypothetical protein C366_05619 [Cryptococcus neoformans var. grubii Tu401-1]